MSKCTCLVIEYTVKSMYACMYILYAYAKPIATNIHKNFPIGLLSSLHQVVGFPIRWLVLVS